MNNPSPLQQALMLMQQQAYPSAKAICQKLLARKPDDFNARHLLGLILLHSGDPAAARDELSRAAELPVAARFRAQAHSNLSLALGQLDQPREALAAIEQAITLEPGETAFHLNRLNLLEQLEAWQSILDAAGRWPALDDEPDAQYALARARRETGRLEAALARLDPLPAGATAELVGEWALLRVLRGEAAQVAAHFAARPVAQLAYVADYLAEQGATDGALPLYRQLLERDPEHAGARHMIDAAGGQVRAAAPASYVRSLYDTHAQRFERHLVGRLGYDAPTRLADALAIHIQEPLARAADLGCGSGLMGAALRKRLQIGELSGCDLSTGMLEQARRKGVYERLDQAGLIPWLRTQAPFDLICTTDVLIYIGDLGPVMELAANRLTPDGWFAFTVERGDQETEITPSGRYRHSESHIRKRAMTAGLELISCEPFPLRREAGEQLTGLLALCRPATNSSGGVKHE